MDFPISVDVGSLFFKTFLNVNLIFPPFNLFFFIKLNTPFFKKYDLRYQSVLMATRHCDYSTSLMEFLIYMLVGFPKILLHEGVDETNDMEYKKLLVGKGLCKILELSGFEKNMTEGDET